MRGLDATPPPALPRGSFTPKKLLVKRLLEINVNLEIKKGFPSTIF